MGSLWSKSVQISSHTIMNYPESKQILGEVKKASKILLNCHRGPDSDSVGSALGLYEVLKGMGKNVSIICPDEVPEDLRFLENSGLVKKTDFENFDFKSFDLFIILDSSTFGMASGYKELELPKIRTVILDHHHTNSGYGTFNLVDSSVTSTSELLYLVLSDWGVPLSKNVSEALLVGILGDTGIFQHDGVGSKTLRIASDLIDNGANKDKIVLNMYKSTNLSTIKFWGKIIESMQIDEQNRFVWSEISNQDFLKFGGDKNAKEDAANMFFPIVKNTDFGVIMIETELGKLSISLRSRNDFDVSAIAEEIGGGGHKAAAGAKVEGLVFNEAVEKVLEAARKYARKTS